MGGGPRNGRAEELGRHRRRQPPSRLPNAVLLLGAFSLFVSLIPPAPPADAAAAATTTVEVRVSHRNDDAEERANGSMSRSSSDLELVFDQGGDQVVGIRFGAVDVPAGSSIVNAWVQFTVDETNSQATDLTIQGEASLVPAQFSSTSFDISGRPPTGASVAWSPPAWSTVGEAGPDQQTPDLTPIIQELVDQTGWVSGNPMVLIISGSGERTAESFNGDAAAAPLLHIEYQATGVTIAGFTASPTNPAPGEQVTFSWSVSDANGDPVSCTLDVDDDGTTDYTIPDCLTTTTQTHTYPTPGVRTARLVATNQAADSDQATTIVTVTDPNALVFEQRVNAGNDDAEEAAGGNVSRSSSDLELVNDGSDQTVGMRYANVTVPPAATIVNAWVQFTVDETTSQATDLSIQGQLAPNAGSFSSTSFDISGRPPTGASVAWSPPAWSTVGEAGPDQQTPDLTPIIQEIVDQLDWESGNALAIIVTGSGRRTAESFNGDAAAAPLLHIEYRQTVVIDSFTSSPTNPAPGEQVTFSWSVRHLTGGAVSCTLDVDDDGTTDYTIPDCLTTTTQTHTYATEAYYTARLNATDGNDEARSSTLVNVVDPQTVIVAAAGDIACDPTSSHFNGGAGTSNNCRMLATSDVIVDMSPHAVLALGDTQYEEGTLDQFLQSYDLNWGRFKDITYPAVGNHEYITPDASGYFAYYGAAAGDPAKGYYSVDVGNWHIISLNTNCSKVGGCSAGSPQEQWLRADLAANPASCTLAYFHHPRFSSGAIGNIDWSRDMWQALHEAGAELVLAGHDHNYERFAPQDADGNADPTGPREFVVGTGGRNHTSIGSVQPNSEVRHSGTYGVLKLTLRPTSYEWEFVPEAGETFTDTGTADCQ